eukprot:31355-Amphidinium_carterae.1
MIRVGASVQHNTFGLSHAAVLALSESFVDPLCERRSLRGCSQQTRRQDSKGEEVREAGGLSTRA